VDISDTPLLEISEYLDNDILQILHATQNRYSNIFYFKDEAEEVLCLGSLIKVISDDTLLNLQEFIRAGEFEVKPRIYGGISFFNKKHKDEWKSFEPFVFHLPLFQIERVNSKLKVTRFGFNEIEVTSDLKYFIENLEIYASIRSNTQSIDISKQKSDYSEFSWTKLVDQALESIEEGNIQKIVLVRNMKIPHKGLHLRFANIIDQLVQKNPESIQFILRQDDGIFIGSTPEILAYKENTMLHTMALAGSQALTEVASVEEISNELLNSKKNKAEHDFVVDGIKTALANFTTDITHDVSPSVMTLPNILHLKTNISADIKVGTPLIQVIKSLHPTPALGGNPRENALELIDKLEVIDRGWFGSPIGYLTGDNNGKFVVAIRSALITPLEVIIYAGAGIVKGSKADTEWQETNTKLKTIYEAILEIKA
jgi:menaquinone-specific isochorismate synthase